MATIVDQYTDLIEACQECAIACEACLAALIDKESGNDCPRCCLECVDICTLCARAIARESRHLEEYCRICAEACEWCATQCRQQHLDVCRRCAEVCDNCAVECRKIGS